MTSYLSSIINVHSLEFVGLQETMRAKFSPAFLRKIDPGFLFSWEWLPSHGKSGGILCGVRSESFNILGVVKGRYIIQLNLFHVKKNLAIAVLVVYGSAHEEHKVEFLSELASFCNKISVPYVVRGDFNVLRHCEEKNTNTPMAHSSDVFNSIIHMLDLREIFMSGGMFTWINNHDNTTLEKLDKVLMSSSWEDLFPLVFVSKFVRDLSDHNPLILDCGILVKPAPGNREFRFDIAWLKNDQFLTAVESIRNNPVNSEDVIDVLNIKLKIFKKYFKRWGSNLFGHNRKRRHELQTDLWSLKV